jgi:hypothetical protein
LSPAAGCALHAICKIISAAAVKQIGSDDRAVLRLSLEVLWFVAMRWRGAFPDID